MHALISHDALVTHPLPANFGFCTLVPGFLSADECRQHIERSEARGYAPADSDYPPSYRNNDRQVVDDAAFAHSLLERLVPHAPATLTRDKALWALEGINQRFRFCRYRAGQQFNIHQDGVHHRGAGRQSCLTFMIYLTDGDDFGGGDTLFYSAGPAGEADGTPARLIGRVRPRAGSLILFDHTLWHAGETVTSGVKHILRSDVVYRRRAGDAGTPPSAFEPAHEGYVWTLARTATDALASGGRDSLIRLWRNDGQSLGSLQGHHQSVLGLAALPGGRLASVSRDRSLRLWDVEARRCEHVVISHTSSALSVTALPGGDLATGAADALVKLWRGNGDALATLRGHEGWVWSVVALTNDVLVSASEDGTLKLWRRGDGQCLFTLPGSVPLRDVLALDGRRLVSGDIEGRLAIWESGGGGWHLTQRLQAHDAAVRRLRMLGSGLLATTGEDNRVRVWKLADWSLLSQSRHDNFVTDVLALPDGGHLSCSYDGRIATHSPASAM
jgi:predicted 2-oxoglutarate/Fe(II)-dependent dioxygenase YbiX